MVMNIFKDKQHKLDKIKLIRSDDRRSGILYALGTPYRHYVVKELGTKINKIGYSLNIFHYISDVERNKKIQIDIDNVHIILRKDGILLLPFNRVAIELKTRKVYKCSADEFEDLKTNLSNAKFIILKNT
jgi:hypothetical protein